MSVGKCVRAWFEGVTAGSRRRLGRFRLSGALCVRGGEISRKE